METGVFHFWQPEVPQTVKVGPDERPVPIPDLAVPLLQPANGRPTDHEIGEGVYAWLRQSPDHPDAAVWAAFLADAYPHYVADLAAHAVMLNAKNVDAPYLRRMLNCLKILALIEPERADLQAQIGRTLIDLAFQFAELPNSRHLLLEALGRLNRARSLGDETAATCDALARVNFFLGDYPLARQHWQSACDHLGDPEREEALKRQLERIDAWDVPPYPLLDDLETLGQAITCWGERDYEGALDRLAMIERRGELLSNMNMPVFYHLRGLCLLERGDRTGAADCFRLALAVDESFAPAIEQLEKLDN
ncbi:MAG: hypothetical protein Tsb0017_08420 [Geothermobacteraceae bacterium]